MDFDIVAVPLLLLIAEPFIVPKQYWALSPLTIFVASFVFVYAGPYLLQVNGVDFPMLNRLGTDSLSIGIVHCRIFIWTWSLSTLALLFRLRRKEPVTFERERSRITNRRLIVVFTLFIAVFIVYLGAGVGYSFALMLDRLVRPRQYTYIIESLGPLTYAKISMSNLAIFVSVCAVFEEPRSLGRRALFAIICIVVVFGGTKLGVMSILLFYFLAKQKYSFRVHTPLSRRIGVVILLCLVIPVFLLGSFTIYSGATEVSTMADVIDVIADYPKECYYTPLVISNYEWRWEYVWVALLDTLIAPVPRVLWPEKPYPGFYKRYWHDDFEPESPDFHTTTFGMLSEGHMILGPLAAVIYGIALSFALYWSYGKCISTKRYSTLFGLSFFCVWTYFITRDGFTGTTPWLIPFSYVSGLLVLPRGEQTMKVAVAANS